MREKTTITSRSLGKASVRLVIQQPPPPCTLSYAFKGPRLSPWSVSTFWMDFFAFIEISSRDFEIILNDNSKIIFQGLVFQWKYIWCHLSRHQPCIPTVKITCVACLCKYIIWRVMKILLLHLLISISCRRISLFVKIGLHI